LPAVSALPGNLRFTRDFFRQDVLHVAPRLIGQTLVRSFEGREERYIITETEAYRGEEDEASHARFGKTRRNRVMYDEGGIVYVYFIYGMYWMLNIVTGEPDFPQAVLIRSLQGLQGPGVLTRALGIDRSFYGEDLTDSTRLWVEPGLLHPVMEAGPRIGISYAGEPWKSNPWRYRAVNLPVIRPSFSSGTPFPPDTG
jgi:DNA-3-methyladenine glycosylase